MFWSFLGVLGNSRANTCECSRKAARVERRAFRGERREDIEREERGATDKGTQMREETIGESGTQMREDREV